MPNQLNYGNKIQPPYVGTRPERLDDADRSLVQLPNPATVIFGTHPRENVELWMYDTNGNIAGHKTYNVSSPLVSTSTLVDNAGTYEIFNMDVPVMLREMYLEPGRYTMVANFFRDEIGTEEGNKLIIAEINDDRTELKLQPVQVTAPILREMYEWVVPSVPKIAAQALIDQTFGKTQSEIGPDEVLTLDVINQELNNLIANTVDRIQYAGVGTQFTAVINTIVNNAYVLTLDKMAADVNNPNIQQADLERYIIESIQQVISQLIQSGQIDPRLEIS